MERQQAIAEVRENWRTIIAGMTGTAKHKVNGEISYICPLCGHGKSGDGITINKKSRAGNSLKCFGSCNFSGDIIDLVMQTRGVDFNTALSYTAAACGITLENDAPQAPNRHEKGESDKNIVKSEKEAKIDTQSVTEVIEENRDSKIDLLPYYEECSKRLTDPAAVSYLSARGISIETAAAAHIGYDAAADPARSGHKTPRIIIPTSRSHYVARSIDPNTDKQYQKMNNKGGTPGIFNAAAIYKNNNVFVTEGAFDALSLMEIGHAAIAINSTSNAKKFIDKLQAEPAKARFILCMDKDNSGAAAQELLKQELQRINIEFIEADITGEYKDANEALQANKERFAAMAKAALEQRAKTEIDLFLENIQTEAYKPAATGLKFFDDLLSGGITNQTLTIVLAAPAAGKTTLCQQVGEAMALQKTQVVYFNLEMSKEQMLAKSISGMLARKGTYKTTLDILQGYRWTGEDRDTITTAAREYEKTIAPYMKYYDAESIGSGVNNILQKLEEMGSSAIKAGKKAPAVIVDYLHLITNDTDKNLETSELIKVAVVGLKKYAIKYNTFVIAISATNRASNTGKLQLDSARDSSNIDFTGDIAISLNYEDIDNRKATIEDIDTLKQEKPRRMILRIVKGRLIESGKSEKVLFDAASNLFFANEIGQNDFRSYSGYTPFDKKKPL